MPYKLMHRLVLAIVASCLMVSHAQSADYVLTGSVTNQSLTFNRISDRYTTSYTDSSNNAVPYVVIPLKTSSGGGSITATVTSATQFDSFLTLYTSFDAANPSANIVIANDDGGGYPHASLTASGLTADTVYYLVIASYSNTSDSAYPAYGNYTLEVTGTSIGVPPAPTIGVAVAGSASLSVGFTPPANASQYLVDNYRATCTGGVTGFSSTSPISVTGLTNGIAYVCTVAAHNSYGWSAESAASNSVTPQANQSITFVNPGAKNFGTTPVLSASSTSGLSVTFSSSTTGICTITSGGALTFVATGVCTIDADQAGNAGYTAASTVTQSFTVNPVVPGAPAIGSATATDTQAVVNFSPPANNGGNAITAYTVTSSPGGMTATGAGSPITVSGLTNGVSYTFTVTATNSAGTSAASVSSNSVTPKASQTITFASPGSQNFGTSPTLSATSSSGQSVTFTSSTTGVCTITSGGTLSFVTAGTCTINAEQAGNASYLAATTVTRSFTVNAVLPGAPTMGSATAGNGQATVTFSAPASNGGATVTSYTVTSAPGGMTASGTTSPLIVSGLTNGTAYTFTVKATNSVGAGAASVASNSVTPVAPLETSHTGVTAGGSVTAVITGGTCAGFQMGSAQYAAPVNPPAGQSFPYDVFAFTALTCGSGGSVTITQTYPQNLPANARYYKLISGNWVDWTSNVTISGNTVVLTITDGGPGDTNPTAGEISDPGGIALVNQSGPAPIPTLSEWAFLLLAGFVVLLVWGAARRNLTR